MSKISAKDILISVNTGTDLVPVWKKVACSTSDGFSGSTDVVTINSKCTSGWADSEPGNKSWSFSNESYAETEPAADALSYDEIFDLWKADTVATFKIESINSGEYLRQGLGFISSLGETASNGDYLTFNLEITGKGEVVNAITT